MPEPDHVKILILSGSPESGRCLEQVCEGENRQTTVVCTPESAIKNLGDKSSSKYRLLIAETGLQDMDVVAFFIQAKQVSPQTRRMLVMTDKQADDAAVMLLNAVNQAGLQGLVQAHAPDETLSALITRCIKSGDRDYKHARLEQVTTYQNKQMFGIAQRLKKKDQGLKDRIQALQKQREQQSTELDAACRRKENPVTFAARIDTYDIPLTAQALGEQFKQLARSAQILFQHIAHDKEIESLDLILGRLSADEDDTSCQSSGTQNDAPCPFSEKIMQTLYATRDIGDHLAMPHSPGDKDQERDLQDFIQITISPDQVDAFICLAPCTAKERAAITVEEILKLLRLHEISFGVVDIQDIESWINSVHPGDEPFKIATGELPVQGQDGAVTYMFETNYTNPGKIMPDGRIDFRDRGAIPFVHKGDLVAKKRLPEHGSPGKNIIGGQIMVEEPDDPVFLAGTGTRLSEDETNIYADVDGHPHLDPMGEISVSPELSIEGDIDYNTGNVDFNGHIVVSGRVREGFSVKGVSLTAREVEGASLELSGDLCVSDGITDTTVASVGNIFAKFINNSTANAFGDIVVQKEIIDSTLLLSGTCRNPGGTVMGSEICARNGVESGRIGTPTAKTSTIRTGVDDHIKLWQDKLEKALDQSMTRMQDIKENIEAIEDQDQEVYALIAQKSREQTAINKEIEALKNSRDALNTAADKLGALEQKYRETDHILNDCFNSHEQNLKEIDKNKKDLEKALSINKSIMLKKKGTLEFDLKTGRTPTVTAHQGITQGTVIISPHASLTVDADQGRCKIQELSYSYQAGISFKLYIIGP